MRLTAWSLPSLLILVCCALLPAQQKVKTDRERDNLHGPVHSVTSNRLSEASKDQLKGVNFMMPNTCAYCEYDPDGNRIANGRFVDGVFSGERTLIQRNPEGMIERITTTELGSLGRPGDLPPEANFRREIDGPFGQVELVVVSGNKVQIRSTTAYDAAGHFSEGQTYDGSGLIVSHTLERYDADGQRTEQEVHLKGDVLFYRLTWDPATDLNRYTCFSPAGALVEEWKTQAGKNIAYWEAPDAPAQCSHFMFDDNEKGEVIRYTCQAGKGCEAAHSNSTYAASGKPDIRHTDYHDGAGKIVWSSDYEYQFDSHQNWTHRKIWLTIPGQAGPILYAEDTRAITYWDK